MTAVSGSRQSVRLTHVGSGRPSRVRLVPSRGQLGCVRWTKSPAVEPQASPSSLPSNTLSPHRTSGYTGVASGNIAWTSFRVASMVMDRGWAPGNVASNIPGWSLPCVGGWRLRTGALGFPGNRTSRFPRIKPLHPMWGFIHLVLTFGPRFPFSPRPATCPGG